MFIYDTGVFTYLIILYLFEFNIYCNNFIYTTFYLVKKHSKKLKK